MADSNEKNKGSGFCHFGVGMGDFEKTLNFYIEGLGFKQSSSWVEGNKRVALLNSENGSFLQIFEGGRQTEGQAGIERKV